MRPMYLFLVFFLIGCSKPKEKDFVWCKATLIKREHFPTILCSKYVNYERYITTWDCGKHGVLISDDEKLFRAGRSETNLKLHFSYWGEIWIQEFEDEYEVE